MRTTIALHDDLLAKAEPALLGGQRSIRLGGQYPTLTTHCQHDETPLVVPLTSKETP